MTTKRDPMSIARLRLQLQDPFLGAGSLYLDLEEVTKERWMQLTPWNAPTACTDGRKIMYYGPFIQEILKDNGQTGVDFLLAHETLHVLACDHARLENRDPLLWNMACVTGDTNVLMANGRNLPIATLVPGDYVASPYGPSRVLAVVPKGVKNTVELDIQNSHSLRCTMDHKILTERGFQGAEEWQNNAVRGWVLGETRSQEFRPPELQGHEYKETVLRDSSFLCFGSGVFTAQGITSQARGPLASGQQFSPGRKSHIRTTSLSSRNPRRGRNSYDSSPQSGRNQILPASGGFDSKHFLQVASAFRETGVSWLSGYQQLWPEVLGVQANGLRRGLPINSSQTLVSNQGRGRGFGDSVRNHAATAKQLAHASNARNVRDMAESQGAKSARIQIREGVCRASVYDIITEHHCFYANGVLVHNCDYRIHDVLAEGGWTIPKSLGGVPPLYDSRFKGLSAEQVYPILRQEQDAYDQSGGKKGKNHKGNAQGPGVVVVPCDKDGKPLDAGALQAEANNWQAKAQQAAEMAKSCGKLKGSWERMVGEVMEPKIAWEEVLRRFVRDARNRRGEDFTWSPANRRAISRGLHFPAIEKIGMGVLDIHVDLSGSIGQKEMDRFCAEIQAIRQDAKPELTRVIYFDAAVCRVDELQLDQELDIRGVKAGGGTDFKPSFEWVEASYQAPACAVVLTDLCCSSYPEEPPYAVMWASTVVGSKAPWGQTLELEVE